MIVDPQVSVLLWNFAGRVDEEIVRELQSEGCQRCGGPLDRAKVLRKPHGLPPDLAGCDWYRLGLCCRRSECRGRVRPASLRFPDRRRFNIWFQMVAMCAVSAGKSKLAALAAEYGVSRSTLRRWKKAWAKIFRDQKRLLMAVVDPAGRLDPDRMPHCLIELIDRPPGRGRLLRALQALSPIWLWGAVSDGGGSHAEFGQRHPNSFPLVVPVWRD